MRLEDHMDLLICILPRRRQCCFDLRRMMPVVIHYRHAIDLSFALEPSVHSSEIRHPFGDLLFWNIESHSHCDRRRGIQHVMQSRNMQVERPQTFALMFHEKPIMDLCNFHWIVFLSWFQLDPEIRSFLKPVCHRPSGQVWDQTSQFRIVVAQHCHSVERQTVQELYEC